MGTRFFVVQVVFLPKQQDGRDLAFWFSSISGSGIFANLALKDGLVFMLSPACNLRLFHGARNHRYLSITRARRVGIGRQLQRRK